MEKRLHVLNPTEFMRTRPSARLLVIDQTDRVLLFRFKHTQGALAGQDYWATPGGGLMPGETFEAAAVRELYEETGIKVEYPGPQIGQRSCTLQLPDGEYVIADEKYFVVRTGSSTVRYDDWTEHERQVMAEHRWWSIPELQETTDIYWPEHLLTYLHIATTNSLESPI